MEIGYSYTPLIQHDTNEHIAKHIVTGDENSTYYSVLYEKAGWSSQKKRKMFPA